MDNQDARPLIYSKISKAMIEIGAIGKHGFNKHDKYKFRSIDDVINGLHKPLIDNGIFIIPEVLESDIEKTKSAAGNDLFISRQKVKYKIFAEDGSFVEAIVIGEGIDRGDKAANKALTAAFKYMAIQVFCIPIKDLDDADKDSPEIEHKKTTQQSITPQSNIPPQQNDNEEDIEIAIGKTIAPYQAKKFKGKQIKDIPLSDLKSYVNYFANQNLNAGLKEFVDAANIWIEMKNNPMPKV